LQFACREKMSSHIIEYKTAQNIKQLYDDDDDEALLHEGRNIPWSEQKKICHLPFGRARKKREKLCTPKNIIISFSLLLSV
jgi:hypothetical protein